MVAIVHKPASIDSDLSTKVVRAGYSPPHGGGVAAPLRRCREASEAAQTGWSLTSHISECVLNTACERRLFLMAAPYVLMFRAIALTLRAGLRGLRPPSAPQRRLRDIFLMSRPPLLREEGSVLPEKLRRKKQEDIATTPVPSLSAQWVR